MNSPVVRTEGLWHKYTRDWALKDVDLTLEGHGVVGLLGSNGAGKSTLMNILCGCISQTTGAVSVCGLDVRRQPLRAREQIGFLPQQAPVSLELTIEEYLRFCAGLRRMQSVEIGKAVAFVIDRCGLAPMRNRLIGNLSGGYRQRVGIAQALVHKPRLIVLDEPTVGLDPNQISGVRELIREIGKEHTVVFSTHILTEVEALCRDVLMIEKGEVLFHGDIGSFRTLAVPNSLYLSCAHPPELPEIKHAHPGVEAVEMISPTSFRVRTNGNREVAQALISKGQDQGWGTEEIYFEESSLEDVFKSLTEEKSA